MIDLPWVPASEDVAPHLRQYLRTEHGAELADFTAETTISQADVLEAINSTVADMAGSTGPIPEELHTSATTTAAIGAAAEAVIDRDDRGRELYRELRELFEARLGRLIRSVRDARDGTQDGVASVPASGSFPDPFGVDRTRF